MRRMADLLYHYTTINSLLSIVRGRAFWASDMRHANDATETTFGREEVRKRVEESRSGFSQVDRGSRAPIRTMRCATSSRTTRSTGPLRCARSTPPWERTA